MNPTILSLVALGGAIGSVLRYLTGIALGPILTTGSFAGFPLATFLVNILGSGLMGLLAGLAAQWDGFNTHWRPFLMIGVLGGFTTFSSFSLESIVLWERGAYAQAGLYVSGSVILSLLMFFAGLVAMRLLLATAMP